MIKNLENHPVIKKAIDRFGGNCQLDKCEEECLELALALKHKDRGIKELDNVAEEIADVMLTVLQAREIVGKDIVDQWLDLKIKRLWARIG
jgi:NTP pyrophosphatase (non-canonical NTP hydrolase)